LALYCPYLDQYFWEQVALHPSLDTIVLSDAFGVGEFDPKSSYLMHTNRPLRVVFNNYSRITSYDRPAYDDSEWETMDPANNMAIFEHITPDMQLFGGSLDSDARVREAAEDGLLWDWTTVEIVRPGQLWNCENWA
jgi:hypothetical protein